MLASSVHGEASGRVVHGAVFCRRLEAAVSGANLQLFTPISEAWVKETDCHPSRAKVLLNASIDESMFCYLNWLGAEVRGHVSHQRHFTNVRGVAELHTIYGLIGTVVYIGGLWIKLPF